jgi:hypothetical protein
MTAEVIELSGFVVRGTPPGGAAKHLEHQPALVDRERPPERKQGQFVGVINELTRLWRTRRLALPIDEVVNGNAVESRERHSGLAAGLVVSLFEPGEVGPADADCGGNILLPKMGRSP